MSYIESSTASPLSKVIAAPSAEEDEPDAGTPGEGEAEEEEEERRAPKEKAPAGSLKAALVEQIEDINLARNLDEDRLDQIGMDVVREYDIDENSRAGWVLDAKKAMKFAMQRNAPKTSPWPGASNVIFPLISQSAIDFAARTYPAIVQNRSVVKGVVWGSDTGTPVTADGSPDGAPLPSTGAAPAAPAPAPATGAPAPGGMTAAPGPGQSPQEPVWLIAPGDKRRRADKIGEHMSWQLLEQMPEWEPQTDQLLHQIPIAGGMGRKTFYDPVRARNRSLTVSLMNLVWNYHAPSFEDAPRHTEKVLVYPNTITEYERFEMDERGEGMWLAREYGVGAGAEGSTFNYDEEMEASDSSDPDAPQMFLEQHRMLDLDDDGYAEPYIVTVHQRSSKVVRIVARYDEEGIEASDDGNTITRIKPVDQYTLYPFFPNPDGGSYPIGFGHILRPLNEAINTTLNQMFDAGTLQNAGGGFVSDQLGSPSGQTLFQVGRYVRVNSKGGNIRDAVFPIPFPGPSTTLFQLLGTLVAAGKELASLANVLAGDAAIANAPPTTILALIEQGMKIYTGIHKRIYRAEKSELAKLYRLNRLHLKEIERYQVGDEFREITKEDYRLGGGVEPIADPTMTTDMQKLGRANILMGFNGDPLINQVEIRRRLFEAASFDRIDELFVPPDPSASQMQMAMAQAELGKRRSEELKNQTQAFLNMALARKNTDAKEEGFIEQQLTYLRLSIEAVNSQVKAAAVDHKFHDTAVSEATDHARMAHEQVLAAMNGGAGGAAPTPGPTGSFPLAPTVGAGPAVNKPTPGAPPGADLPPTLQTTQPPGDQ